MVKEEPQCTERMLGRGRGGGMAQQVRTVLDVKGPDVVAHTCNPRWKMKTRE